MVEKPNKLQAALLAGIIFGALSSIPFVNWANLCCCLWVVIGGAVAARTLINRSPVFPVTSGDGAAVGAITGAISAGVYLVLGIPLALLTNELVISFMQNLLSGVQDPNVRRAFEDAVRQARTQSIGEQLGGALLQWLIVSALAVGFATLGGVIGVAIFEKRKGQPMPPSAPQPPYGGGPPQY
ncbi:MAG TPA: hypothetical protein VJH03_26965 [Blastocatellia bacterium]|nr:hypothetical protein [Blastocatellia bacterium]